MNRTDLNKEVQNLFSEKAIVSLKKFVEYIDSQNPDIIVLMARKAICLFELFSYLDIRKPNAEIVSDRTLDLELEFFRGKKVIIVDDTLIVGSTLQSIKTKLISYGIDFKIVVFSVDSENWQKNLIIPNYIQEHYSSEELLNFCINEVKAFSLISMPYLVDFPITNFIEINRDELKLLLSNPITNCVKIAIHTHPLNELYTLLLNNELKESFFNKVGVCYTSIVEVLKIRLYISNHDEISKRIKFVPIVLLKPLSIEIINELFLFIINFSIFKDTFIKFIEKTEVKLRVIQYYLSFTLGKIYIEYASKISSKFESVKFRSSESINLFGKTLSDFFESILDSDIVLPYSVKYDPINGLVDYNKFDDIFDKIEVKGYNIIQSFQNIFTNLFDLREIPARNSLKEGNLDAHLINRLDNGIPFCKILSFFSEKMNLSTSENSIDAFSICLDVCNDLGLSIPIICSYKNIYFRAYRHGELGKRTIGNIYLFYKFIEAFCKTSNHDINKGFDNILLEKLAVIYFRIAAKEEFIDVVYDYSDPSAINIGFYLMGAVLVMNENVDFFPNNREDWFLNAYCFNLLKSVKYNEYSRYYLNNIPIKEGISIKKDGEHKSRQLGFALGKLFKAKKEDIPTDIENDGCPLNIERLTILASCYSASDFAMALGAEVNIIFNWLKYSVTKLLNKDFIINSDVLNQFQQSTVYQSFNQAFFKFSFSLSSDKNVYQIINDASKYLNSDYTNKDNWDVYSKKLGIGQENILNIDEINPKLLEIIYHLLSVLFQFGNKLHYVRYLREIYDNITSPIIGVNSEFIFESLINGKIYKRKIVRKFIKDTSIERGYELGFLSAPGLVFRGKRLGEIFEFNYKGQKNSFKIIKIINYNIDFESYLVFKDYNDRLYKTFINNQLLKDKLYLLPQNYNEIEQQMIRFRNNRNKFDLNNEMSRLLRELKQEEMSLEDLTIKVKNYYTCSRDNIVSLLF